jgi:hypothetical protein
VLITPVLITPVLITPVLITRALTSVLLSTLVLVPPTSGTRRRAAATGRPNLSRVGLTRGGVPLILGLMCGSARLILDRRRPVLTRARQCRAR